jgi:replication factor C small subunit
MQKIGDSSLWVEKYRPQTIDDQILPTKFKRLFKSFVESGELQNIILSGSAGCGKSTAALAI